MIRDWRDDDATSLARYANNRKIWSNLRDGFPYPYARDDAVLFISRALQKEPRTVFAIACEYAFNSLPKESPSLQGGEELGGPVR